MKHPFPALLLALLANLHAAPLPTELNFTRQAVARMVFDDAQAIPLGGLDPAKIVGLEIMHPVTRRGVGKADASCQGGLLHIQADSATDTAWWFAGFNPFATYSVDIASVEGLADVGLEFHHPAGEESLAVTASCRDGKTEGLRWKLSRGPAVLLEAEASPDDEPLPPPPFRLTVQMVATGFNVLILKDGLPKLAGRAELVGHLDLRRKTVMNIMSSHLLVRSDGPARVSIRRCSATLTPGMGQADIRCITDDSGAPLLDGGKLWFTATVRGGGLQHPAQGVFSMDPAVFDPRFEGLIVFDRGDGLLRNELASHLFLDRPSGEWRGWTTAFSAFGDPNGREKKEILAIRSTKDPRHGFSIMRSTPMGLVGDYEDPQGIHDPVSGKWLLLLCQNQGGYKAAVFESDRPDGGFTRIAGPVSVDSTGTTLVTSGGIRHALFGSADRSFHVCSFPDLKPLGKLKLDLPPWDATTGGRVWPCLIDLPEGYPARHILLTFDRFNFPGMNGPNWTYGAMYLYHGHLPQ